MNDNNIRLELHQSGTAEAIAKESRSLSPPSPQPPPPPPIVETIAATENDNLTQHLASDSIKDEKVETETAAVFVETNLSDANSSETNVPVTTVSETTISDTTTSSATTTTTNNTTADASATTTVMKKSIEDLSDITTIATVTTKSTLDEAEDEVAELKVKIETEDTTASTTAAETTTDTTVTTNSSQLGSQPVKQSDVNTTTNDKLSKIKKLKSKLINEEHRLVLMKKIRQSQTRPVNPQQQLQNQQQQAASLHPQLNHSNSSASSLGNLMNNINSNQSPNPAKKLRPNSSSGMPLGSLSSANLAQLGQQAKNLLLANPTSLSQQVNSATVAALNQTPAHAHQRPKSNNLWTQPIQQARQPTPAGIAPPHVGNLNRPPITTPPNVVQAMMGDLSANQQSLLMNQINALTANAAAAISNTGINKRSSIGNLSRQQAITTPPNVVQDVRLGLSGQQQQLSSPQLSNRRAHINNMSRQPLTTPQNMVHDNRGNLSGQQSLLMNASNLTTPSPASGSRSRGGGTVQQQSSLTPQQPQSSPFNKSQAAQMLLQKRQAAKSAIQKQLEQTLMQLPEKRIQLGIDFIPNANNIEFIYYIGLEACVDYLTNTKNPLDTQPLEKPFQCSTCETDFTPSWSWKRSNPVCENCVSNHVKKSIKNSQTNRIKSVLSKAAKQEQEMDQRIMAEAASVVSSASPATPTTSTNQRHSSLLQPVNHQAPQQRSTPQATPWPRVNPSPLAPLNRTQTATSNVATSAVNSILPNLNLNSSLAALGNLQPAALASLLQMNPQIGSLASLMTANAMPQATQPSNNNQIAQVAALLMNQLTMNLWNKR